MSPLVFAALFLTLFALLIGVPRAMNRGRPHPEEGVFAGLIDDLDLADLDAGAGSWVEPAQRPARRLSSR